MARGDADNLFGRFAWAKDDLWESGAHGPVVIHMGKSQIFERQIDKPVDRGVSFDLTRCDLLQQAYKS